MSVQARRRPVVVVVDDEEGDRDVMEAILSDDYVVIPCPTGEAALRTLEDYPTAIVLCDQRMPGLTGDEVVTRIRVLYPDTVRILVTAYTDAAVVIRALNEGRIFAHIEKPFDPETLRAVVEQARRFQVMAIENQRLLAEIHRLKGQVDEIVRTGSLAGGDSAGRRLEMSDDLTALYNPKFLRLKVQEEQQRILRYGNSLSILLVDVDDFREVARAHGPEVADRVLRQVGGVLRRWSRAVDFVARVGEDDRGAEEGGSGSSRIGLAGGPRDRFLVLSPNTLEPGALILAERLRRAVIEMVMEPVAGRTLQVTVSIGVATCEGKEGPLLEEVIRRAEQAVLWAKKLGKNRVVTWSELKEILVSRPQSRFVSRQNPGEGS